MTPRAKLIAAAAACALALPAAFLYFRGPASALAGLSRSYYNAVYARTLCPGGALGYEDKGVAFSYLDAAVSPDLQYSSGAFDPENSDAVAEAFGGCVPLDSVMAGNVALRRYAGCPASASGEGFGAILPRLRENFGAGKDAALAELPGKPGLYAVDARYRTHVLFRDSAGIVYWLSSPRLPMQAGSHGFFKELAFSCGLGGDIEAHYIGLARWLRQPAGEKRSRCNFDTIIESLRIK